MEKLYKSSHVSLVSFSFSHVHKDDDNTDKKKIAFLDTYLIIIKDLCSIVYIPRYNIYSRTRETFNGYIQ